MLPQLNCNFNHLALSVPKLEPAIKFYTEVFGLVQIKETSVINATGGNPPLMSKLYGPELMEARIAFLGTGNNIGFELFEFTNPKYTGDTAPNWTPEKYTRGGIFHFCFTDPDPLATMEKAKTYGAKQVGITIDCPKDNKAIYMEDPWGNVIELLSCTFEHLWLPDYE